MKEFKSNQGYKIIEMTQLEIAAVEFGNICDHCNYQSSENMFYVAALNRLMCKDCFENYIQSFPYYDDKDSLAFENKHYNSVLNKLKKAAQFDCDALILSLS